MARSLRDLLCELFTWRREYEARVYRHAAPLMLQNMPDMFSATQVEALNALGKGELPVDAVFDDKFLWGHLRAYSDEGETCVKQGDAEACGIPAFARRTWNVAVPLVVDAVQQARPGHYVPRNDQHRFLADYCRAALANNLDPDDWFSQAIELLDKGGFADALLRELWRECPHEAKYRQLPRPADTMPPMTDGHRRSQDVLEGSAHTVDELTLAQAAREFDVPDWALSRAASKASNNPGHLPTRRDGSNVYVDRDHAREFSKNFDARREQRIVGSKSDEGRNIIAGCKPPKNSADHREHGTP